MRVASWVRWAFGALVVAGAAWGLSGCAVTTALVVTTSVDSHDVSVGDGVCDDGAGRCSLRAALEEASAGSAAVDVTVPAGTYPLSLGTLTTSPGAHGVTVHAPQPGAVVDAAGAGSGVVVGSGSVTVLGLAVTGASGPGMVVASGASLRLGAVSVHHNAVGVQVAAGGSVTASISTVADNAGAGFANAGSVDATNVTVTANGAGGFTGSGSVVLGSSVVADQVGGANCAALVTSAGFNLVSDATCVAAAGTDVVSGSGAGLGGLSADALAAHEPLVGSGAIDTIPGAACGAGSGDQLGTVRPVGVGCDRGAIEADFSALAFTVNTAADGNDVAPGDGICNDGTGHCSLRAAITEANLRPTTATHTVLLKSSPVLTIAPAGVNDNSSGDLDVFTNLTITAVLKTIDGGGIDRVFHHHAGHLTLSASNALTITGGVRSEAGAQGGAVATDAQLTLDHTNVAFNRATGVNAAGGGLYGSATASITITNSTVQANSANGNLEDGMRGGAIAVDGATLSITDSTIINNAVSQGSGYSGDGGALAATAATVTIERSLISGNHAIRHGGAFLVDAGSLTVQESTISGNLITSAFNPGRGSAINANGQVTLQHVTMVGNRVFSYASTPSALLASVAGAQWVTFVGSVAVPSGSSVCDTDAAGSGGYNLLADLSCGLTGPADQQDANPVLASLAANGGPSATYLPHAGSPAVDAIPAGTVGVCDASTPLDQRRVARPAGGSCDIGAVEGAGPTLAPLSLTVDTALDAIDVNPGDAVCNDGAGHCTLRAAVTESNARPTTDTITVAPGVDPALTIAGAYEDANVARDLDVTDWVVIHGNGATLEANHLEVAVTNHARGLTIDRLTITHGNGAIRTLGGTVTLTGSALVDNAGPGIAGVAGSISITSSTIAGNHGPDGSGAVDADHGRISVRNSSLVGNSTGANDTGAAVGAIAAPVDLRSVTITGNHGADTIAADGPVTMAGSVIVAGARNHACRTAITSGGHNLVADSSCGLGAPGDLQDLNPLLGPLAANGGPTLTQLPYANSPVVDAIPAGTVGLCDAANPVDQRGSARPANGACDMGAVEGTGPALAALNLTVNVATDAIDVAPGDGTCADGSGQCTLRAAVTETNLRPTSDTITIQPGVHPALTRAGRGEDANLTGDLDVTDWLTLHGSDATIEGNHLDRVLEATGPVRVLVDHVTITGGLVTDETANGGGIATSASLELDHVSLIGNAATGGGARGGALFSNAPDTVVAHTSVTGNQTTGGAAVELRCYTGSAHPSCGLTVSDSTVATNLGTGIAVDSDSSGLTLARTRVTGNAGAGVALEQGGSIDSSTIDANSGYGLVSGYNSAGLTITNSTFNGNLGGSAVRLDQGAVTIRSSTLSDPFASLSFVTNSGTRTIGGSILAGLPGHTCEYSQWTLASEGYNVIADTSCAGLTGPHPTDRSAVPVKLQALGANGGPTPTRLPFADSDAVDLIPAGTAGLCDGTIATDQRGVARPQAVGCDAGAAEGSAGPAPSAAVTVTSGLDTHDAVLGDGMCADGLGVCTLRAAIDEANAASLVSTISIAPGVHPTLSLAGAFENANVSGDLDITAYLTIHGNGAVIDAAHLDRVIDLVGGSLTADNLTIRGGVGVNGSEAGAGLNAAAGGSVVLDAVTVTANANSSVNNNPAGAGIYAAGAAVTITNSTIAANTASGTSAKGGGLAAIGSTVTISNSTISGNNLPNGGSGGGLYVDQQGFGPSGSLVLARSTVSGNSVGTFSSAGGGLFTGIQPITIDRSTISGNTAFSGAAIEVWDSAELSATTVFGNTGFSSVASRNSLNNGATVHLLGTVVSQGNGQACFGPITSGGYNAATDTSCALAGVGDLQSAVVQLGPLASNGGPTGTHLPAVGSPLLDAIPVGTVGLCDGSVTLDQRGLPRPSGAACDIGSVER